MTKHNSETLRQCQNCDGYGCIEGRYCDCSIGQMMVRDAIARGDHVAVAYNHETGKKEVFADRKHRAPKPFNEKADRERRAQIERQAAYYFSEIRKFQPLDLDHLSLENWKDFIMWRERNDNALQRLWFEDVQSR